MGCIGYKNYQHFLQFAFWASLHTSIMAIIITVNYRNLTLTMDSFIYYVSGSILSLFGWVVFFLYGTMALKGVTIIEANQLFQKRRQDVGLPS
jgi:hypothetical protein